MKKNTIKSLFEQNKGKNFVISTDVAVGHGLNGVSYTSFTGKALWKESSYGGGDRWEKTEIVSYEEDYLLIKVDRYAEAYNSGIFTYAIPYEHIVTIMFVEEPTWCNRLAKTL